jgi:hypothetical protein
MDLQRLGLRSLREGYSICTGSCERSICCSAVGAIQLILLAYR